MANTPPVVVTAAGPQPIDPATARANLISSVASTNPGYTSNLPGSLVEDVSSTEVASIVQCDNARVETVNSLTPWGANLFTLQQLGSMLGISPGTASNTSVGLIWYGNPGDVIPAGFVATDGTYQYVVQDGGVVQSAGYTLPLSAVSPTPGAWAVPANSVNQIVTSLPADTTISGVTNPLAGTPGGPAESGWDFRARVLQANLAPSIGCGRQLKTMLLAVPGTSQRLVSFRPSIFGATDEYEIIVGGGDDFLVAEAIWSSMFDYLDLVGSIMAVTDITNANPAHVTTALKHGYVTGAQVTINGIVGMTPLNGALVTVTNIDLHHFSIAIDTTSFPAYVSGGVVTPNPRNFTVPINDYPDTYFITFVRPPQQTVVVTATWNTDLTNFTGAGAVAQLSGPALVDYINSVAVGAPLLVNVMEQVFAAAIANVLPIWELSRLVFAVSIDGVGVSPSSGTFEIFGDPESFFYATASSVIVNQG